MCKSAAIYWRGTRSKTASEARLEHVTHNDESQPVETAGLVSDFDFDLPPELIAQHPPAERGGSRLLVLSRETGAIEHARFADIGRYLRAGDLLVVNDTRVYPGRLLGRRVPSGGAVECLLVGRPLAGERAMQNSEFRIQKDGGSHQEDEAVFMALVHPGQKLKPGARMVFEREGVRLHGEILDRHFHGRRTVRLWTDPDTAGADGLTVDEAVDLIGHVPLPPYIRREDVPEDRERYQTVFARARGSIAAPTAGLHFTESLIDALHNQGVETARVTLHVGYGTFKPVRVDRVEDHVVDAETFEVDAAAAETLTRARRERRRIIAVGTTTARTIESLAIDIEGRVEPARGATSLFIRPGHRFQLMDGLLTNFHLPRSSLLMLVAAFGGRERVLAAYREAVGQGYRFYSYGDAMLVL
jgi:S-adenosylmethionine:tRNA ribosyltransferase-isomerase